MTAKNYVLDTNVLLHDARAMYAFADNHVVIPIYVLEEIDNFKKDLSELGRNARQVARQLDMHREEGGLATPVSLERGGTVRVALGPNPAVLKSVDPRLMDNLILELAMMVRDTDSTVPTILVTKDVNMRIRGDALGLESVDYEPDRLRVDDLYSGSREVIVADGEVDELFTTGKLATDEVLSPNEYVLIQEVDNPARSGLARYDEESTCLAPVRKLREGTWGIRPRNKEQHYALDALLDDNVKLVSLLGKAGTGKTLLAIAAGLQKITEEKSFHKLLVSRPIFPLGRDIGYLPGDIQEKLTPWMQPIYDNLELLMGLGKSETNNGRSYSELMDLGYVEIEALTYIRGRSLPNVFMIVDEAQNLTPHEIKTIITRAGEKTKIVLTGDPNQIDNPYVDVTNNGLTVVAQKFKEQRLAAHVQLTKGERSELAELATQIL